MTSHSTSGAPRSTYIHPAAFVDEGVFIGEGTHVGAGVRICAGAVVGSDVHLSQGAFIGGDTVIENEVWIGHNVVIRCPALLQHAAVCGSNVVISGLQRPFLGVSRGRHCTIVGRHAYVGPNCTLLQGVSVGDYSAVAPNTYLNEDVDNALRRHVASEEGPLIGFAHAPAFAQEDLSMPERSSPII